MTIERKEELKKVLLKMVCFSGGALLAFGAGSCAAKTAGQEELKSTKKYYAAPIAMKHENGTTTYAAPVGFELAYDENGLPYCYKTIVTDTIEPTESKDDEYYKGINMILKKSK